MTAEIAVMNKKGIALAADSAATNQEGKIFNSHNKLFMLSKYYPIGVMVYQSSEFMGYPWENIIKRFRKEINNKGYENLEDCRKHFLEFLESSSTFYEPNTNKEELQAVFLNSHIDTFLSTFRESVLDQLKAAPGQDYNKLLVDSVINFNHNLQLMTDAEGVDALFVSSLLGKHLGSVTEKVKQVYLGFTLNDELVNTLAEMAVRSLLKKQVGTNFSGVVIAGFGEAEQFPRCYNLIVKQIVENKLIWFKDEELEISLTNNSSIIPFAQTDIAQTFIRGIDPNIETDINNQSQILIRKWEEALSLIPPLADNQANHFQQLRDVIVNHVAATKRIIDVKKWSTITKPLLNGIASSNLAELATMAETLINLTSFRLKFTSNVTETVGGPIDVAVISKGDGFIWVKRKHYFEKEYNFHFFQNYFREIKEEDA